LVKVISGDIEVGDRGAVKRTHGETAARCWVGLLHLIARGAPCPDRCSVDGLGKAQRNRRAICRFGGGCLASVLAYAAKERRPILIQMTVKLWLTLGAGLKTALPACSALTVQVPRPTSLIVAPFLPPAVQTDGVEVVNVTGVRPEEAAALTVNGD